MSGKILPLRNRKTSRSNTNRSNTTYSNTSYSNNAGQEITLAIRALPPRLHSRPRPSVVDDPIFGMLFENNLANLIYVINNKTPLPRETLLRVTKLVEDCQSKEPGPLVQYANIRPALSAVRRYLVGSHAGKQLLAFFKKVLQTQGLYIAAATEVLGFEIFVRIYQGYFLGPTDQKLLEYVHKVFPEALLEKPTYTEIDCQWFDMWVSTERPRLHGAFRTAFNNVLKMKYSKEFAHMHSKLLSAIDLHEQQLMKARKKETERMAARQAKAGAVFIQNNTTLNRQMGTSGLTAHNQHTERSVMEFVRDSRDDFFPADGGVVNSEEHLFCE